MQQRGGATAGVVAADGIIVAIQFGKAVAVVGGFCSSNLSLDCAQLGIAIQHEFDCGLVAGAQFLCDMRHGQVARHVEAAGFGRDFAAHQGQQGRFAAAVFAGNADLFATIQIEGGFVEQ